FSCVVRRLRFSGPKTSIICSPMTSLKTSIKTITYLSDIGCLEIQGASLITFNMVAITLNYLQIRYNEPLYIIMEQICIYIKHGYF
ncbi:hypothetical protein, partial [Escherichia albertii]|uniref:hypothetical protein n=1 Tax=Escherichia albertii TaxID=208962 RepID=UPI0035308F9E